MTAPLLDPNTEWRLSQLDPFEYSEQLPDVEDLDSWEHLLPLHRLPPLTLDIAKNGSLRNSCAGERIILPRLLDVANAAVDVYKAGSTPWLAVIDVRDAFMNIPAGDDKFATTAAIDPQGEGNKFVVFDTLVFGSASSPTLWGREMHRSISQIVFLWGYSPVSKIRQRSFVFLLTATCGQTAVEQTGRGISFQYLLVGGFICID
eukprot:s5761_g2.t1